MSRVRDALQRAEVWQTNPDVPLGQPQFPITAEAVDSATGPAGGNGKPPDSSAEPTTPLQRLRLAASGAWRRLKTLAGIRSPRTLAKCAGLTRNGLPCRAPAMRNGYCRMHGGSRNRFASAKAQASAHADGI